MGKILHVVGARPNFPKIAPIMAELARDPQWTQLLVHTGQHYDERLSAAFFRDLDLRAPDMHLSVGSCSHAEQTARIMLAFAPIVERERPDCVVVVGDVNSTLACALVCAKLGTTLAHVEAGLRSRDRSMPEEINRIVTDQLADLLFTPSPDADDNLRQEGIDSRRIRQVGNIMIDSLVAALPRAARSPILTQLGLTAGRYGLVTLHRPANVDDPATLHSIMGALAELSQQLPLVFPVHPRTRKQLIALDLLPTLPTQLQLIEPQGYLDFVQLTRHARLVLTDSGGLQEETTFLGIPCLTLRPNTERPLTVEQGTNVVVGTEPARILRHAQQALTRPRKHSRIPGWDGRTAERIVAALREVVAPT